MYFGEFDCTTSATHQGVYSENRKSRGIYLFLFLHPIRLSSFALTKSGVGPYTDWHANT